MMMNSNKGHFEVKLQITFQVDLALPYAELESLVGVLKIDKNPQTPKKQNHCQFDDTLAEPKRK